MVGVTEEPPARITSTPPVTADGEADPTSTAVGDERATAVGDHDGSATVEGDRATDESTDDPAEATPTSTGGTGTFEAGPSSLGRGLTVAAGLLASVSLAPALPAVGVGVLATGALAYALRVRSGRVLGVGVATLVVALLLGGVLGTPAELLVIAAGATILAWDVGDNALGVGEQLGRTARTARLELVHAAASLAVAVVGAAVAYAVFGLAGGGRPVLAVVLLLLGATILVGVLR